MSGILNWLEEHRDWVVELLRMYLGVVLFLKGLQFLSGISDLVRLLGLPESSVWVAGLIGHYIMLAHLVGGIFVFIGLLTRYACAAQIPILTGAVVLMATGRFASDPSAGSLEYVMAVFLLLVMFLFYGGGRISADYYLDKRLREES